MSPETIYFYTKAEPYFEFTNYAPYEVIDEEGDVWPTVEHYFHAQKFDPATDARIRQQIRAAPTPQAAKRLGRSRRHPIRPDWDEVRVAVMQKALGLKFQNTELRSLLLSTGDRQLVENSPTDYFWGCGKDRSGQNMLGQLLMQLRDELRADA